MAETEQEPKKGFKIVDRRRFTDDGDVRTGPDVAPDNARRPDPVPAAATPNPATSAGSPQAAAPAPTGTAAGAAPGQTAPAGPKKPPVEDVTPSGLTFSIFLQSLAQQALMQLGLIPWPHGQRELHLEQARDTIDIIALLKAKTGGNLTPDEQKLIDAVGYELRMSYVEVQTAIARSKGAPGARPGP